MIYVTSDLHFGHNNVIKYDNRPFQDVEEMDRALIALWNSTVLQKDTVYILGDLSWYGGEKTNKILKQLNGKKFLIVGNHDNKFLEDEEFNRNLFAGIYDYLEIKENHVRYVLFHYPIADFNGKLGGAIHLYGHIHNTNLPLEESLEHSYNVGVVRHNFKPVRLERFHELELSKRHGGLNESSAEERG